MKWNINKSIPICPQVCEQICVAIVNGTLKPKEKLCSVRELALELGVNPNTIQKSFDILETQGIIYSVRCSGWYVAEEVEKTKEIVSKIVLKKSIDYLKDMANLGYNKDEVIAYLKKVGDENE